MTRIILKKQVSIPDKIKLERYKRTPELGPKLLFFSGGTALKETSQELIKYTQNSIHLITPFDSGGSSKEIRDAFDMISIGDLRNRIMALADRSIKGHPHIIDLFSYRLRAGTQEENRAVLDDIVRATHPLINVINLPMRSIITGYLKVFLDNMPTGFNLIGASIGNLILAGGYLNHHQDIDVILFIFTKLVQVRGVVKPIIDKSLHLGADLADDSLVIGQHLITGKEESPLKTSIKKVFLNNSKTSLDKAQVVISDEVKKLIASADLICYPIGSFYSSIIANLLPTGISEEISKNFCPKIYVPNTSPDKEMVNKNAVDAAAELIKYLNNELNIPTEQLLNFILIDTQKGRYPHNPDFSKLERMGVKIIDTELITSESTPHIDPVKLNEALLSLT